MIVKKTHKISTNKHNILAPTMAKITKCSWMTTSKNQGIPEICVEAFIKTCVYCNSLKLRQ